MPQHLEVIDISDDSEHDISFNDQDETPRTGDGDFHLFSPYTERSAASVDASPNHSVISNSSSSAALSERARDRRADDSAATIASRGDTSSTSSASVFISSPVVEGCQKHLPLPDEFVDRGWTLATSKKTGQPYYFNVSSKKSFFEMHEVITHEHIPPMMPLTNSIPAKELTPKASDAPAGVKPAEQPPKIHVMNYLYDHSIPTNVQMRERNAVSLLPAHPDAEQKRLAAMVAFKSEFGSICADVLHLPKVPWQLFARWLAWLRLGYEGTELLFAMDALGEGAHEQANVSGSVPGGTSGQTRDGAVKLLVDALMAAVPCKTPSAEEMQRDGVVAVKAYMDAMGCILQKGTRQFSDDSRQTFAAVNSKFASALLTQSNNLPAAELKQLWQNVFDSCETYVRGPLRPHCIAAVEKLVDSLRRISTEMCERHVALLGYSGVFVPSIPLPPPDPNRTLFCHPLYLRCFTPHLPRLDYQQQDKTMRLTYRPYGSIDMDAHCFFKLEAFYQHNSADDDGFDLFLPRVYALLVRYDADMAVTAQTALPQVDLPTFRDPLNCGLPTPVLVCLAKILSVTFECFASPLNAYFRQFCSAFGDTDGYFGSRGSFFEFHPIEGSFVAHPPHDEGFINEAVNHIVDLLQSSSAPLSFVVCVPDFADSDKSCDFAETLKQSEFLRGTLAIPASKYRLLHPFTHLLKYVSVTTEARTNMLVFILQNDAGAKEWPLSKSNVKLLESSFSQPQESLKAPRTHAYAVNGARNASASTP